MAEPIPDATPDPNPLLAAALAYATRLAWPVIPLHAVRDGACTCGNAARVRSAGKHSGRKTA
ncbi:hypothetical protein [Limnoglobus roseus]|uniref:hypothetical protein n=1 Tax=Limnoglobus roseus TaxID=2598579 RepID=UPI00143D6894|nr:hypothetical protein [Limnoglobus roseus]